MKQNIAMLFLSKKNKVTLQNFIPSYYSKILPSIEPNVEFFRILKNQVAFVDKPFSSVDFELFLAQMTAIWLECFGLAFFYRFGDKLSLKNNLLTREYLLEGNKSSVWDDLGIYNSYAAKSATYGSDSSTMSGRARISLVNNMRVELFNKYHSDGFDDVCIARTLNRYGTKIEVSIHFLVLNLSNVLKYEFNENAKSIFVSRTFDFYMTCMTDLKKIKIVE